MVLLATSGVVQLVSNLAWPAAVLLILLLLTTQRGRLLLRPILRRLRRIGAPGGWEIELSEDAAAETKLDVEGAIKAYAPVLDSEFERLAYVQGIFSHLESVVRAALTENERAADGFRATVHIEDALVRNALYQLVNYWPAGGGAGRRFSVRFGMLGRSWRLGKSLYVPDVPDSEEALIETWGMTRAQATTAAVGRRSFVCILLRHAGQTVGILFMDARPPYAFEKGIDDRVEDHPVTRELATALGLVRTNIAGKGPGVKLLADD